MMKLRQLQGLMEELENRLRDGVRLISVQAYDVQPVCPHTRS